MVEADVATRVTTGFLQGFKRFLTRFPLFLLVEKGKIWGKKLQVVIFSTGYFTATDFSAIEMKYFKKNFISPLNKVKAIF